MRDPFTENRAVGGGQVYNMNSAGDSILVS